jgi:hypothetical protein
MRDMRDTVYNVQMHDTEVRPYKWSILVKGMT